MPDSAELERDLNRIPGIIRARVVLGPESEVTEVHVLAGDAKQPKQLVRDIQTVALAGAGVTIDHRCVSIVQMRADLQPAQPVQPVGPPAVEAAAGPPPAEEPAAPTPRWKILGVSAHADRLHCRVDVHLGGDDREVVGTAEGVASGNSVLRVAAEAALLAVMQMDHAAPLAEVDAARVVRLGEHDVASVSLVLVENGREELLVGSAAVRADGEQTAVVRAVLDATNRRLAPTSPA